MLLKKQLGANIKQLRKQRNLTQEQFAEYIHIDPKNVSKIENGKNYPTAETLSAIAQVLQVDFYELFIFVNPLPYATMKQEIINALENKSTLLLLYKTLKNI